MSDEMWALQRSQLGTQSVLNTGVAATVRLQSMTITDQDNPSMHEYMPQGELFATEEEIGIESSTHKLGGNANYNELLWLLTGIFGTPVTTTPGGGTNSRQHVWTPPVDDVWTPKIYTLERGSTSGRGRQYPDFIISGFQFDHTMNKYDLTGDAFANAVVTGHALTSSLAAVGDQIMVKGEQTNVYLDTSSGALGTTQLTRYFENKYGFSGAYAPEFPGTRSNSGFITFAQLIPTASGTLTLEGDSVGEGVFSTIRAGSYQYMRIDSLGPVIESTIHYELKVDMAIKFSDKPSEYKNVSDFSGLDWPYKMVKDPAWTSVNASGQACQITLVNKVAAVL